MSNSQKDNNVNQFNKFLENNQDFLQQKYGEYFVKPSISLKDLKYEAGIKFIYDVFSFTKYQSDQKMNQTLKKSLNVNIKDFISILSKKKQDFNLKTSIQLLKYCIQNNEMFAVKYDKKDKKMKTEEQFEEQGPAQNSQLKQQTQRQEHKQAIQQQKQQQDIGQQQYKPQQQSVVQQNKDQVVQLSQSQVNNQFEVQKQQQKKIDPELIKKNLKEVFQFYCRQQQNIGAHTTFDRISHECHTMTLGKFIIFATTSGVKNDKIDRHLLTRKFKLAAQGKKQIDFQLFYQIIQVLAAIDQSLIPKLGVDDKAHFKNQMKLNSRPFNTQDLTFRQAKRPEIFIPKLTGHSGKLSDALADELKQRKQLRITTPGIKENKKSHYIGTPNMINKSRLQNTVNMNRSSLKNDSVISPKELATSNIRDFDDDLNFLQRMVNAQQADQEWLKDYKLPHKTNLNVITKKPQLHPMLATRKNTANVVSDIKKRVTQLEKSETKQSINMQKRRVGMRYSRDRKQRSSLA